MADNEADFEFNGLHPFNYIDKGDLPGISSAHEFDEGHQNFAQLEDNLIGGATPHVTFEGHLADTMGRLGRPTLRDIIKRQNPPRI